MNDLMGGHIEAGIATVSSMMSQYRTGLVRIVGIGEKERFAALPEVQAIGETVPGFEATSWLAFYAPAATPKPVVDRLNQELVFALTSPEVKQKLFDLGLPVVADKPEGLGSHHPRRSRTLGRSRAQDECEGRIGRRSKRGRENGRARRGTRPFL